MVCCLEHLDVVDGLVSLPPKVLLEETEGFLVGVHRASTALLPFHHSSLHHPSRMMENQGLVETTSCNRWMVRYSLATRRVNLILGQASRVSHVIKTTVAILTTFVVPYPRILHGGRFVLSFTFSDVVMGFFYSFFHCPCPAF